jgi:hypothetical protein
MPNLPDLLRRSINLLDNGGFEIWQRGTSFPAVITGSHTADRWRVEIGVSATVNVDQISGASANSGKFACRVNVPVSTGTVRLKQNLEDFTSLRGKKVSLSVRINRSTSVGMKVIIGDDASQTESSPTGTGSFEEVRVTRTINSLATEVFVAIEWGSSETGQADIDSAMLVIGSEAVEFVPTHPHDDLSRCLRHYETGTIDMHAFGGTSSTNIRILGMRQEFRAIKAATPTITETVTEVQRMNNDANVVSEGWLPFGNPPNPSGILSGAVFTTNDPTIRHCVTTWTAEVT